MSRIISGQLKGRVLGVPAQGTRPTSERIREAIFAKLDHWSVLEGAVVLDLFAGSGALGFEAVSRGAAHVDFVDAAKGAVTVLRSNASHLNIDDRCTITAARAERFLASYRGNPWDLVFLDPPYDLSAEALDELIARLGEFLSEDAVLVVERDKHSLAPSWPDIIDLIDTKSYGSTVVYYAERARESTTEPAQ